MTRGEAINTVARCGAKVIEAHANFKRITTANVRDSFWGERLGRTQENLINAEIDLAIARGNLILLTPHEPNFAVCGCVNCLR